MVECLLVEHGQDIGKDWKMRGKGRWNMREHREKLNNCGFTLVEMIVVVLIIGIISTGAVMSISSINRAKANGCTEKLVKLLDQTRTDSMSRVDGAVKLVINERDGAYYGTLYISDGTVKEEVELGDGGLRLEFFDGSTLVRWVDETASFTIKFKKGNGGLSFDSEALRFDRIVITGSNTKAIKVYEETGRYRLQ